MIDRNQLRTIIIEDELVIAQNLKEQLFELGYQNISICRDQASFIKAVDELTPDLLFVDIHLQNSDKTGIDIVKESGVYTEAAIIILSSYDDNEYRKKAQTIIADAYLIKPADHKQIDVTIDIALQNKHRMIEASKGSESDKTCTLLRSQSYFFTKKGDQYEKVLFGDICYANASGSYVDIYTIHRKRYTLSVTLKHLLEQITDAYLVRCHRGFAVNPIYIQAFDDGNLFIDSGKEVVKIPIGSNYKSDISKYLPKL